jgi:NAD+ synthase
MGRVFNPELEIQNMITEIKKYFVQNGGKTTKAIIGISGGKDSTIAAALLVRALGAENVFGVLMPCGEQADIADSYKVVEYLHIPHVEVNIGQAMEKLTEAIPGGLFGKNEVYYTNTPARLRMTTLYGIAALVGGRVVHTGNASEMYVGYTTKFGDMAGDFSIFYDFYVREILAIGDALRLPAELVYKAPGDGMTGKTDEDNFGFSYDVLDAYLLDNETPSYEVLRLIEERHERNLHKMHMLHIPYIRARTRKWENDTNRHGGCFEVLHEETPFLDF